MNIDRLVCGTFLSSLAWLAMSRGVTEHKTDDGTITAELHFCSSIITEELTMGSMTGAMTESMIDLDIELTIGVVGTSGSKSWFTGVTGEYTGEIGEVGMSEDDCCGELVSIESEGCCCLLLLGALVLLFLCELDLLLPRVGPM